MNEPDQLTLKELRNEFSSRKTIPEKYETVILSALSHYPELKDVKINFVLKEKHPIPYGTTPVIRTLFGAKEDREYKLCIREEAEAPDFYVLLKNLSFDSQVGVIGHELAHVVQYESMDRTELLLFLACYFIPEFQQKVEQAADMCAIIHGLGNELLEQSIYVRSIPAYIEKRKAILRNYLSPAEIAGYLED